MQKPLSGVFFAGATTLIFFVYVFVNIGMVSGILPVVGVPLPLFSYGGTSYVAIMASFSLVDVHSYSQTSLYERELIFFWLSYRNTAIILTVISMKLKTS